MRSTSFFRGSVVFVVCSVWSCGGPDSRDAPAEKAEWALLQGVEASNRDNVLSNPSIRTVDGRTVLGVRGRDGENIWILLKPEAPPYYKQRPSGDYDVSEELVRQLVTGSQVSYTVEHVLRSHVLK